MYELYGCRKAKQTSKDRVPDIHVQQCEILCMTST